MPTMTHTKEQRDDWHRGKSEGKETTFQAWLRSLRAGNARGGATPKNAQLFYKTK